MAMLITGATGVIGGELTKQLIASGDRPRLLVRTPAKARQFEGKADIVEGDLGDAESLAGAMKGVDRLFLLASGPDMPRLEETAIRVAKKAGVRHVVKLSVAGADDDGISLGRWHRQGEKAILASGIPYTFLRPVNFMSNTVQWAATIKSQGAIFQPLGEGKAAYIDPADIGAVAARALAEPASHANQAYLLTGPEPLSTAQMASIIAKAIGKPVRYVDVPLTDFAEQLRQAGLPPAFITAYTELFTIMKEGRLSFVDPTVERLLGRKPQSFASWVERHVSMFT